MASDGIHNWASDDKSRSIWHDSNSKQWNVGLSKHNGSSQVLKSKLDSQCPYSGDNVWEFVDERSVWHNGEDDIKVECVTGSE